MQINNYSNHDILSTNIANFILNNISSTKKTIASFAAGNSTKDSYRYIAEHLTDEQRENLFIAQMDEYIGVGPENKESLYNFLRYNIIREFKINPQNILSLDGKANKPMTECNRYQQTLKKAGPLDLCVLGIGVNGHIAFNEPGSTLEDETRILTLDYIPSFCKINSDLIQVITLGLKEIYASKTIVLVISGSNKKHITERFLNNPPTNHIPASLLKTHPNIHVFINEEVFLS
jgi:6-phosphogluconolactonase/glucosamine-6-phosphate isomerase/deaminase